MTVPPPQRASDSEREHTAETLRMAAIEGRLSFEELDTRLTTAFGAATRDELRRLVADLPGAERRPLAHASAASVPDRRPTRFVLAVMSGARRTGAWLVGRRCSVLTVMGGSQIDLNAAELSAPQTRLRVVTIMGGSRIRVPLGLHVRVRRFALMGGNDVELGSRVEVQPEPVLNLQLLTLMGGAKVRRGRRRTRHEEAARIAPPRR